MEKIYVFGHRKPDTDSVGGAIALAYLKKQLGYNAIPVILSNINSETKYALDFFNLEEPMFLNDVKLKIKDLNYSKNFFINENKSLLEAYNLMVSKKSSKIPVVGDSNNFIGVLGMKDIAKYLINYTNTSLNTTYDNILNTIEGEKKALYDNDIVGNVIVASYKSTTFIDNVNLDNSSILIVGDRHSIIEYAVNSSIKLLIISGGVDIKKEHLKIAKQNKIPLTIIGNGSNLLVSDAGYRGVIVQIYKEMNEVKVEGDLVKAQAGALLSGIAAKALGAELSGFEFASGIPGTIGGACVMNAGAYGGEMKQIIQSVSVIDETGKLSELSCEEMDFSYRHSLAEEKGLIVTGAVIELKKGDVSDIQAEMDSLLAKRREKQPLAYPSAGSTFKRPEGYFAGKLIMDAGLRGYKVGGAQVSEKHCGFVINTGEATAQDVVTLMDDVVEKVKREFGVTLEPEVKMLGEF